MVSLDTSKVFVVPVIRMATCEGDMIGERDTIQARMSTSYTMAKVDISINYVAELASSLPRSSGIGQALIPLYGTSDL